MIKKSFILVLFLCLSISAQENQMGVSTGEARTYSSRLMVGVADPSAPRVFEDITEKTPLKNFFNAGGDKDKNYIVDTVSGSVAVFDYDNDGKPDIYLLNGGSISMLRGKEKSPRAALYRNLGNFQFEDVTAKAGVANESWGWAWQSAIRTTTDASISTSRTFPTTRTLFIANDGEAQFSDVTFQAGLGEPTIPFLGWGTGFFDFDNDGWKDIFVANGHVYPQVDNFQWGTSYAQQLPLFRNGQGGNNKPVRFSRVGAAPGSGRAIAVRARGLAIGDLGGDGRLDTMVNNIDSAPTLLRNVSDPKNHWLRLRLVGDVSKRTPKDAIGSTVFITAGGVRQRFDVISGASYASNNDQRISIGLGAATKIDRLEIRWAGGAIETLDIPGIDRALTIEEGRGR